MRTVKESSNSGSGIAHGDSIAESFVVVTTDPRGLSATLAARSIKVLEVLGVRDRHTCRTVERLEPPEQIEL